MTERGSEGFERAAAFLAARRAGRADAGTRRILLRLYGLLAEGAPVTLAALAARAEVSEEAARRAVAGVPGTGIARDAAGRIVGFGGLTLEPTRHSLSVGGRRLYTWCAFDTLFAPQLLGTAVDIASTCPATGKEIRLRATPEGVEEIAPAEAVLSFVTPDLAACNADIRGAFCCHVAFYASREA